MSEFRSNRPKFRFRTSPKRALGFTLVELLTVVAIMVVMMILVVPALANIGRAQMLRASGDRVANLLNSARQNSMSQNVMTALIMITDPTLANQYRSFALWELDPPANGASPVTSNWKQITSWETLDNGIIADPAWPANSAEAFASSSTQPPLLPASMALPSQLACGAQTAKSYEYLLFLPTGGLVLNNSSSFLQMQLVQGFVAQGSSTPVYTGPALLSGGGRANYYRITTLAATGRIKIDRP